MEKVYFKEIRSEMLKFLSEAKFRIDVAMAWFTSQELLDCLVEKLKDGIKVRLVILDDEINRNDNFGLDFSNYIEESGELFLYNPSEKLMHNKYCIIDDEYLVTGSYNWTNYAESRNLENVIITDERSTIKSYRESFENLCCSLEKSQQYNRIPAALISRESYKGNYIDYEIEKSYFEKAVPVNDNNSNIVEHDNRQFPKSAFNIGFHAYINGNNDGMRVLVDKGTDLPFAITKDSWLNNDDLTKISCEIYYGDNATSISGNQKLVTLDLDIPKKRRTNFILRQK